MIKLIASDMDGTLLNERSEISGKNAEWIRRAKEAGIKFVVCTGRNYEGVKDLVKKQGIEGDCICLSGAVICKKDGTKLLEIPLSKENIEDTAEVLGKYNLAMDILTASGRYVTLKKGDYIDKTLQFIARNLREAVPESVRQRILRESEQIHFIKDWKEMPEDLVVYKICSNQLEDGIAEILKREFLQYSDLAAASSFPDNIEITNVKAQKGVALKKYAQDMGIDFKEIMVLGDSDNDLSMFLPEFGYTVAMENAMQCVKERANFITKSNRENGVAWAIQQLIFQNGQKAF